MACFYAEKQVFGQPVGGVMALSMLTACGSTTTTTTTESPVENATTSNAKTGVVATVMSTWDEDDIGRQQTEETLTGNESTDLAYIKNVFVNREIPDTFYANTALSAKYVKTNTTTLNEKQNQLRNAGNKAGAKTLAFVPKGGWTEDDLAKDILEYMKDRYTEAKKYTNNASYPTIKSISVFDFSGAVDTTSIGAAIGGGLTGSGSYYYYYSSDEEDVTDEGTYSFVAGGALGISASGDSVISVDGTEVDLADCWVIVITMSSAAVLS